MPIGQTILSAIEGILVQAEKKEIEVYYDNTADNTVLHDPKWTGERFQSVVSVAKMEQFAVLAKDEMIEQAGLTLTMRFKVLQMGKDSAECHIL